MLLYIAKMPNHSNLFFLTDYICKIQHFQMSSFQSGVFEFGVKVDSGGPSSEQQAQEGPLIPSTRAAHQAERFNTSHS